MRQVRSSTKFRRDLKRVIKRGYDLERLEAVIDLLRTDKPLLPRHHDHALKGDWLGSRDCHIAPDWLLIYELTDDEVILQRTGTHADLFDE